MRRRVLAVVLLCCFLFGMFAAPAKADEIERVEAEATGVVPASVTVTLRDPSTETALVRLCVTSQSQGQLVCITI
jgi:hypothetical protein